MKPCIGVALLLILTLMASVAPAFASEAMTADDVQRTYFVANDNIIGIVDYCHIEKNAFEGEGFYNDAMYGLLAIQLIIDGSEEYDLYGLTIYEFAASEDDDGVMFALPLEDSHLIMRVNFDTYVAEIYEDKRSPDDYTEQEVLRLIAHENGYTGFSSRFISKEVMDFVFEE